ncbi:MAG: Sec-independent protein translocase protein TatB [Rhodoferax sp.]
MLDIGVTKLAIIGGIALVVIGPERLPGVARMAGNLLGRARRYMAEVKAEVNRSMELDELKKMKDSMEGAAREVQSSIESQTAELEKSWTEVTDLAGQTGLQADAVPDAPQYRHPNKRWRLKRSAVPNWYKARSGVRTKAQSAAARVARFRPTKFN